MFDQQEIAKKIAQHSRQLKIDASPKVEKVDKIK